MLHTFIAYDLSGEPFETTIEGELEWHPVESLQTLPMAEGDRTNLLFCGFSAWNAVWNVLLYEEFQVIKRENSELYGR